LTKDGRHSTKGIERKENGRQMAKGGRRKAEDEETRTKKRDEE
jgi:hypothetical protein